MGVGSMGVGAIEGGAKVRVGIGDAEGLDRTALGVGASATPARCSVLIR
jgi:hypothetical protein